MYRNYIFIIIRFKKNIHLVTQSFKVTRFYLSDSALLQCTVEKK
jgi:hypothetical protein